MSATTTKVDVLISGAGSVGLFLGICLHKLGIRFMMVERRTVSRDSARAVSIQPPCLEFFDRVGLTAKLLERGVKLKSGRAYSNLKEAGELAYDRLPPPHNYVLLAPQYQAERVLEEHLLQLVPGAVRRGKTIESIARKDNHLEVTVRGGSASSETVICSYLVGSDGPRSKVRTLARIEFEGESREDCFVMGDFTDQTGFGPEARVYLDAEGFLETYPLPGGVRRWVMQTQHLVASPKDRDFCAAVLRRTGIHLENQLTSLMSSFGVERYVADAFVSGRIILTGDTAHVMNPIGGQGLNLGWMDAWDLAGVLQRILQDKESVAGKLEVYNDRAKKRAREAVDRLDHFLSPGRNAKAAFKGAALLNMVRRASFRDQASKFFSVHGL